MNVRHLIVGTVIAALTLGLPAFDAEAKRLGGGGIKRSVPTQPAPKPATPPQNAPAQQQNAAPTAPAAAAAAAPAKRSWMGPLAGLAAGLGLAALASHFGFGEALANIMTMVLIGLAVMLVIGFVMRRMTAKKAVPQGMQFAGAGAPFGQSSTPAPAAAMPAAAQIAAAPVSNADDAAFEQIAKRVFIRMQAANDAGDQNDLRRFTTPQMYASIQQELLDRKGTQRTDVLELQAQVVDRAEEQGEQIVSVRFSGLIREHSEEAAQSFNEIWHLVRPLDESREWAIAGIQTTD
jgi:predicted lipid-binding transport protein (Tim44 family)